MFTAVLYRDVEPQLTQDPLSHKSIDACTPLVMGTRCYQLLASTYELLSQ
jgi:hypothetical protein